MLVTPLHIQDSDGSQLSLTLGRTYEVLAIEADWYRILTDEDHPHCPFDPVLHDRVHFTVIDNSMPGFWLGKEGDDGEIYAGPAEWQTPGYFEDYHDGVQAVRDRFWSDVRRLYPWTWETTLGRMGRLPDRGAPTCE